MHVANLFSIFAVMVGLFALVFSSSTTSGPETDSANSGGWKLSSSLKRKIAAFLDLEYPPSTTASECACACHDDEDRQLPEAELKTKVAAATATSSKSSLPPHAVAMDLATANWKAQATRAFVVSGMAAVMEDLCGGDEDEETDGFFFVPASQIAAAANLQPGPTYRLLRYLSTLDVTVEGPHQDFSLGPVGKLLTPNHPQSVSDLVVWEAGLTSALVWDKLPQFLETDKMVSPDALQADNVWQYLEQNPDILATFSRAMTGHSKQEEGFLTTPELSPTFDLSSYPTICDLGAAEGRLSRALVERFPNASYILADLPEVLARLEDQPTLLPLPPNFSLQPTNFLKQVPPKADAYILKHILHDWDDEQSSHILQHIRKANPDATLFIIEFGPMPGPNEPHLAKGFDLHMAVLFEALERTQSEYDDLWQSNGYRRVATHYLGGSNGDLFPLYVQEIKAAAVEGEDPEEL